jgi:spore germination protein YaaH
MVQKILPVLLLLLSCTFLSAQVPDSSRKGIHQVENEQYSFLAGKELPYWAKSTGTPSKLSMSSTRSLTKKVLGWHPYWVSSTAYLSYDYNALSHIAYFSYEVDTATGGYTSIHDWNTTPIIDYAHQRGTKVLLTVTNFGTARNTELLSDTIKQKFLINTLITLLKGRNGDGINFDLESVALSQKTNLVSFISRAVTMIKAELPEAEISMASPAVDWSGSWNLQALSQLCDYLIVMGYDYYWKGSTTAGPVAPLAGENYNVTRSIDTYLAAGVTPEKLLLGVPWYGYDWPVVSGDRKASATGTATSRIYTAAAQISASYGYAFDITTSVPWVRYTSSSLWRQLWWDDTLSLSMKYYHVVSKNLGGIGIWALSYEGGSSEMWRTITTAFTISSDFTSPETGKGIALNIYPNPVSETSTIQFHLAEKESVTLKIFDLAGRMRILLFEGELNSGSHSEEFNSAGYGPGYYLCVLQTKKAKITRTILVVH